MHDCGRGLGSDGFQLGTAVGRGRRPTPSRLPSTIASPFDSVFWDDAVNGNLPCIPDSNEAPRTRRRWRGWLRHALSLLVVLVLIYFLRNTLLGAWEQFRRLESDAGVRLDFRWGWCLGAGAIYVLGVLPAGWFWYRVLRDLGQQTTLGRALRAYIIGHLGKYVPGKLWVVFLRVGLVAGPEVQPSMAAAAVFIETLTMMAVGSFLAAVYLVFAWQGHGELLTAAVCIAAVAVFFTLPPVFKPILRIVARKTARQDVLLAVERLGFRTLWQGWIGMFLLWTCFGISLWMTLRALGLDGVPFWGPLPRMVATAAMATVCGFVIILLPGGLGVREFVLVALLAPYLTDSHAATVPAGRTELTAVLAAGLLRVIWLLAEVAAAVISWFMVRSASRSPHKSRCGRRSPSAAFDEDAAHRAMPADLP